MILLDFDGTIVDLWPRYHAVFCALSNAKIDIMTYKELKQTLKRDEALFHHLNLDFPIDYFKRKTILLEDINYLQKDELLVSKDELLRFFRQNNAHILTSRRFPNNFIQELEFLGLSELCKVSICVQELKANWVKSNISEKSLIIGDDIKDLQVASNANFSAIMVLSGLGTKNDFIATGIPHKTIHTLQQFLGHNYQY